MIVPLTYSDALDAKNIAAPARSSGLPQRPAGILYRIEVLLSGSFLSASVLSVAIYQGAIPLILMPLPAHSLAKDFIRLWIPPLLAAYPGTKIPP